MEHLRIFANLICLAQAVVLNRLEGKIIQIGVAIHLVLARYLVLLSDAFLRLQALG